MDPISDFSNLKKLLTPPSTKELIQINSSFEKKLQQLFMFICLKKELMKFYSFLKKRTN